MRTKQLLAVIFIIAVACMVTMFTGWSVAEEETVGGGDIIYTNPVKSVVFSHKNHAAMGLDCNVCHDKIFQMAALTAESQPDFNMKGLADKKYCGSCHAKDGMAFASDTQCARCHIGTKGFNKSQKQAKK